MFLIHVEKPLLIRLLLFLFQKVFFEEMLKFLQLRKQFWPIQMLSIQELKRSLVIDFQKSN